MRDKNDTICYCMDVTYGDIQQAIEAGATTLEDVMNATDAGITCGYCIEDLEEILDALITG